MRRRQEQWAYFFMQYFLNTIKVFYDDERDINDISTERHGTDIKWICVKVFFFRYFPYDFYDDFYCDQKKKS